MVFCLVAGAVILAGNIAVLERTGFHNGPALAALGLADVLLSAGVTAGGVALHRRAKRRPALSSGQGDDSQIIRETDLADAPAEVRAILSRIFETVASLRASPAYASGMFSGIDRDIDQLLYSAAARVVQAGRIHSSRRQIKSSAGHAHKAALQRMNVALDDAAGYLEGIESGLTQATDTALRLSQKFGAHFSEATDWRADADRSGQTSVRVEDLLPPSGSGPRVTAADIAARIAALADGYEEVRKVTDAVLRPENPTAAPPLAPPREAPPQPPPEPTPQRASRPRGLNHMKIVYLCDFPASASSLGWLTGLNDALTSAGHPEIGAGAVIAPAYTSLVTADSIIAKMPEVTYRPGKDEARSRRMFERRQAAVRRLLAQDPDVTMFGFSSAPGPSTSLGRDSRSAADFTQVQRYIDDAGYRAAVLRYLLAQLPSSGDIMLIGHGLGAVVAIDLLDHLSPDVRVRRFVTVGAPADCAALHRGGERLLKTFPYSTVDDWTNCFSDTDTASMGRGLAPIFPGAQDFSIKLGHGVDTAERYLTAPAVTSLIADMLYPLNPTAESDSPANGRLTQDQFLTLLKLRYAEEVGKHIKDGEHAQRYADALTIIRDDFVAQLSRLVDEGQELPTELHTVIAGHMPSLPHRLKLRQAVSVLATLTAAPLVKPYDIDTRDASKRALVEIATELGFQRETGNNIVRALTEVTDLLRRDGGIPWGRIGVAAAGVALLAAGPVGLAIAAPVGAAGGAAIVGGLAAFGPGGMVGGLGMLGGLAAGGAGLATSAILGGSNAEVFSLNVSQLSLQVAINNACKRLKLPIDSDLWSQLATLETQVSAEINRLEPFNDHRSARLAQLNGTKVVVQKLLRFVVEKQICDISEPA